MNHAASLLLIVGSVLCVSAQTAPPAHSPPATAPGADNWTPLFNGKNLDGWTVKINGHDVGDNFGDTFRVEDGVLKVAYDKYTKFDNAFGHLFYKDQFSHYRLRVEYRFVGEQIAGGPDWALRNNGLMFHSQSPQSMRKDQDFPVSIEAQFLGGEPAPSTSDRPTMSVCTPGTNIVMPVGNGGEGGKLITQHCTNSTSRTFRGDQWVIAEIEVHGGGVVKHIVNGETVLEYEQPQLDPSNPDAARLMKEGDGEVLLDHGFIAIQSESAPTEFRRIEIQVLKP